MKHSEKPVRQCHKCPLNLGDRCWRFTCPRCEWRHHEKCPGFENEDLYAMFQAWRDAPRVLDGREIRRIRIGKRKISRVGASARKRLGRIRWSC